MTNQVLRAFLNTLGVFSLVTVTGAAQVNILTANYTNDRTNANLQETQLTPTNVSPGRFGKIGTFPVDGEVYAQPLHVSRLSIPGQGTHNVLFVFTQHNSVYAYDADAVGTPILLWNVNLGPSVPTWMFHDYSDIRQEVGILSTGAIDLRSGVLYVVSMNLQDASPVFRLHALDLTNGQETLNGPVIIDGTVAGVGAGSSDDGFLAFAPKWHIQRPGLLLANDAVYIAFGSHGDQGLWHGWLMTYSASDLTRQLGVFVTTANGWGGSIWQSGRAPAVDENGSVYVVTGNGDYDGISNYAESFLKLSGPAPNLADWFTPFNWQLLADWDRDLSAGPALIPGTHLLVGGDKAGQLYLINGDSMGHLAAPDSAGVQTIQAVNKSSRGIFEFAVWSRSDGAYVYVQEEEGFLKCYKIVAGSFNPWPVSVSTAWAHSPYVGMAISANGGQDGTGILWETTGFQTDPAVTGTLHAFDASNIALELWNSDMTGGPDGPGTFAKFATPTVAGGRVYVPTFSNAVAVYGLLNVQGRRATSRGL
jgi:hypothetical protein